MTVKITKEAKKWLTVAQMPIVHEIIANMKEDETTAAEAAKQAASIIFGYSEGVKVFEATAEIAGNQRINNYYTTDSGTLDIWINFSVFDEYQGFVTGGAYLSDVWQQGAIDEEELKSRMFLKVYKSTK